MSTEELLTKILEKLSTPPAIPLAFDLWDIASIASYLKRDPQVVLERMACLPSFPRAIRLPTKTGRAQPLYKATEVIAWTNSHQEKIEKPQIALHQERHSFTTFNVLPFALPRS